MGKDAKYVDAKYVVRLGVEEREQLQAMIDKGRGSKSVRKRARILLKADEAEQGPGWTDERVAEFAEVGHSTVHRIRQRFVEEGFDAAVFRKSSTNRRYRKLDGAAEARLVAEACSPPPKGRLRWTLTLLSDRLVELEIVESIGTTTVHRSLKNTNSNRGRKSNGSSFPKMCPPFSPNFFPGRSVRGAAVDNVSEGLDTYETRL